VRVPPKQVLDDFDHERMTPESCRKLVATLTGGGRDRGFQRAGKFKKAANLIRAAARDLGSEFDLETQTRAGVDLRSQIDELYQTEQARFWDWVDAVPLDEQTLEQTKQTAEAALERSGETARDGLDQASKTMAGAWHGISGAVKNLKPRWVVGGAVAGLAAAGVAAPALAIPLAAFPYVATASGVMGAGTSQWLAQMGASWLGSAAAKEGDATTDPNAALEQFVVPQTLWALVLELQGNSQEEIAAALENVLEEEEDASWPDFSAVDEGLGRIEDRLDALDANRNTGPADG
ncbi:MAG: hypothetical protein N2C14_21105, partial [Planctomycetales bacterium]